MNTVVKIASSLVATLNAESIKRYLCTVNMQYQNELSYGRSARREALQVKAALKALNFISQRSK